MSHLIVNGKQHVPRRLDRNPLLPHIITRTNLPTPLRPPLLDIPLQSLRRDVARRLGNNPNVPPEHAASVLDANTMLARFQHKRDALGGNQKDLSRGVRRLFLEDEEVVERCERLIDASA